MLNCSCIVYFCIKMQIGRKGDVQNRIYGAVRFQKVVLKHHIRYYLFIRHASEHAHR